MLKDILLKDTDEIGYEIKDFSTKEMEYMLAQIGNQTVPDRDNPGQTRPRNHFDLGHWCGDWKEKSACVLANWHKGVPYNALIERVDEPCRIGTIANNAKNQAKHDSKQYRIYSPNAKSCTICGEGGGVGAKTGLYLCPTDEAKGRPVYEVKNHAIIVAGNQYFINLDDGMYMVRKLTPVECARLQTMPDDYCRAVSATQAYRGLGNGWCAEVIIHILTGALGDLPRDTPIQVLSLYDGIGTGRYCLDKMGFTNVEYHAYEIDPYAMKVAMSNYSDIIQHGDAFQVREDGWSISN